MNKDQNKGITNITYNHLNLPKQITFANNNSIVYVYNALGIKIRKTVTEADTQATTHYMGSFQYNNNTLQYIHTAEGYVRHTPPSSGTNYGAFDYVYNYTDHLGNIRLSYTLDPSDQVLKILEENHYYPFGMKHTYNLFRKDIRTVDAEIDINGNLVNPTNNLTNFEPAEDIRRVRMVSNTGYQYKYQGQERQDELGLGWDSFKWRNYDYAIGRFMSIDPLTEEYNTWSPYTFSGNRVIDARELEGLEPYVLFNDPEIAYNNFGSQYNGLSIMIDREISTLFYSVNTDEGERYAYIQPRLGSAMGVKRDANDLELVEKQGGKVIAGGHTHAGAKEDGSGTVFNPSLKIWIEDSSYFTSQDIEFSNNDPLNGLGISVPEVMFAPDGGRRIYYPKSNERKANIPVDTSAPSDPNTGKARINKISPRVIPNVLPTDFNPSSTRLRKDYIDLQPELEKKHREQTIN